MVDRTFLLLSLSPLIVKSQGAKRCYVYINVCRKYDTAVMERCFPDGNVGQYIPHSLCTDLR